MLRGVALLAVICATAGCGSSHPRAGALLFMRGDSTVFLVRTDGSELQPYLAQASYPAVSPDGNHVAFVRRGEVWVSARDGGAAHVVTRPQHGWGAAAEPSWSPDGRTLVFVRSDPTTEGYAAVFSVPATGGAPRRLTKRDCVDAPSTNGRIVLYTLITGDCVHGYDPRIRAVTRSGAAARPPFGFPAWSFEPSWSPNGKDVAFVHIAAPAGYDPSEDGHYGLYVASGDGPPRRLKAYGSAGASDAAWSRDGSELAFAVEGDYGTNTIWVIRPDGSGLHQVTHGPAHDSAPAWR